MTIHKIKMNIGDAFTDARALGELGNIGLTLKRCVRRQATHRIILYTYYKHSKVQKSYWFKEYYIDN